MCLPVLPNQKQILIYWGGIQLSKNDFDTFVLNSLHYWADYIFGQVLQHLSKGQLSKDTVLFSQRRNLKKLITGKSFLGQESSWSKVSLDNCPSDTCHLGQRSPWTTVPLDKCVKTICAGSRWIFKKYECKLYCDSNLFTFWAFK